MTRIYLVRHCETIGNVKDIFQGSTDIDINDTGEKQLAFLEKRFSDIKLDRVYSSPLIRARKTARAIAGKNDPEIELVSGLREIHGGVIEGQPFFNKSGRFGELLEVWKNHPEDFAPEGSEPIRSAYERIWETVRDIAAKNNRKTVAAATHGGVLRCLVCRLLAGDISHLKEIELFGNTSVTLLEFDDELNPQIVFMNDLSHLPEQLRQKKDLLEGVK